MLTYDIPVNINVTANTEEEAEAIVQRLFSTEMSKPALERGINNWDFIDFVEGENEEDYDDSSKGL